MWGLVSRTPSLLSWILDELISSVNGQSAGGVVMMDRVRGEGVWLPSHSSRKVDFPVLSGFEAFASYILHRVFVKEAEKSRGQQWAHVMILTDDAHLYHQIVGTTVPKCQRLWASTTPPTGAKSNNSKLIASMIQATIIPGHAAHGFFNFW